MRLVVNITPKESLVLRVMSKRLGTLRTLLVRMGIRLLWRHYTAGLVRFTPLRLLNRRKRRRRRMTYREIMNLASSSVEKKPDTVDS